MTSSGHGPNIVISEEEFTRVVALKSERDALELDVLAARSELEKALLDLTEMKSRHREMIDTNASLGHELELAQQAVMEAGKSISQTSTEKDVLERQLEVLKEQIEVLKNQIVLRDSQIAKRDAEVQSLANELNASELLLLKQKVEISKAQMISQSYQDLEQTVAHLEDELKIKDEKHLLNENRLADMQKALSGLEALLADSSSAAATTKELRVGSINVRTYDASFLDACSKAELSATIDFLQQQHIRDLRSIYLKGFLVSIVVLIFILLIPDFDTHSSGWELHFEMKTWLLILHKMFSVW